jgi:hypothetical protein
MASIGRTKATIANLVFKYTALPVAIAGIVLIPLNLRFLVGKGDELGAN